MFIQFLICASIVLGVVYAIQGLFVDRRRRLFDIPTVGGPSFPLLSYIGMIRSLTHAADIIQEGYAKYNGGCFKYAEPGHWRVLVTSPSIVEEISRAPEDVLSFSAAADDSIQATYTLGANIEHNPYHVHLLRTRLMRNVPRMFDDLHDEIIATFKDEVPGYRDGNEWVSVRPADLAVQAVCRAINRLFVGLPVCRDPDYLAVNKGFTMTVVISGAIIKLFPTSLKPNIPSSVERASKHLEPVIMERLRLANEAKPDGQDERKDYPSDMLQWLIESAPDGSERTVPALALRVLVVNFAALHTTSTILTHTLHYLAAHPEHAAVLREEVERVVLEEGWSKTSLSSMHHVDSFLREVGRVTSLGAISVNRKAMRDLTLSDGTFIPKGTFIAAAARPLHFDEAYYPGAKTFDPWRFVGGGKEHVAKTDDRYLLFGHGRRACPGRFFAAVIMKAMLAHIVVAYDVKFPDGADARAIPPPVWISASLIPNRKAEVLFRTRRT